MLHSPSSSFTSLALKTLCGFGRVGFSGSRVVGSSAAISCSSFLSSVSGFSGSVAVGCARGCDFLVRSHFPSAVVFKVQSPFSRAAFAARSVRLVQWVGASGLLVAFPLGAAPAALRVSSTFRAFGSGTWGSVALALGLGSSVLVVLPSSFSSFPAPHSVATRFQFLGAAPCGGSLWFSS